MKEILKLIKKFSTKEKNRFWKVKSISIHTVYNVMGLPNGANYFENTLSENHKTKDEAIEWFIKSNMYPNANFKEGTYTTNSVEYKYYYLTVLESESFKKQIKIEEYEKYTLNSNG